MASRRISKRPCANSSVAPARSLEADRIRCWCPCAADRAFRCRAVRRGLGRPGAPRRVLPLQNGLQGARHASELPQRPLERRHQLADWLRPPLHRLRRAGLLGQDDALLQALAHYCRFRSLRRHRHRWNVARGRHCCRVRRPYGREDGPNPPRDTRGAGHDFARRTQRHQRAGAQGTP